MTETREINRQKARAHRRALLAIEQEKLEATRASVIAALVCAQGILTDQQFLRLLKDTGITDVPDLLTSSSRPEAAGEFGHYAINFVVVWTFFSPLLSIRDLREYLTTNWPSFIADLKDAFILLVSNGPFPQDCLTAGRPTRKLFPSERAKVLRRQAEDRKPKGRATVLYDGIDDSARCGEHDSASRSHGRRGAKSG